jgi:hypothetical protein
MSDMRCSLPQPYGRESSHNWPRPPEHNIAVPEIGVRSLYGNVGFLSIEWLANCLKQQDAVNVLFSETLARSRAASS